jgi:hypothetical protein
VGLLRGIVRRQTLQAIYLTVYFLINGKLRVGNIGPSCQQILSLAGFGHGYIRQHLLQALMQKFAAHEDIRVLLLSTGEETLIEKASMDYYWGCGRSGTGKNRLGVLLMQVRAALRAQAV